MRTGITLATLRSEVLIEARVSTTSGQSPQMTDRIKQLLNRFERDYATRLRWKTRTFEDDVTLVADAQFGLLPTGMTFTMVRSVWCAYGSEWLPVTHGIGRVERSIYPDTVRASPIRRWEIQSANPLQYEVWPRSAQAETLMFTGERAAGAMSGDSDTCVLDGDMLVLRAAAEILKPTDMKDAQDKARQAEELCFAIQARQGSTDAPVNLASRPARILRPGIDYIPPGS